MERLCEWGGGGRIGGSVDTRGLLFFKTMVEKRRKKDHNWEHVDPPPPNPVRTTIIQAYFYIYQRSQGEKKTPPTPQKSSPTKNKPTQNKQRNTQQNKSTNNNKQKTLGYLLILILTLASEAVVIHMVKDHSDCHVLAIMKNNKIHIFKQYI